MSQILVRLKIPDTWPSAEKRLISSTLTIGITNFDTSIFSLIFEPLINFKFVLILPSSQIEPRKWRQTFAPGPKLDVVDVIDVLKRSDVSAAAFASIYL